MLETVSVPQSVDDLVDDAVDDSLFTAVLVEVILKRGDSEKHEEILCVGDPVAELL